MKRYAILLLVAGCAVTKQAPVALTPIKTFQSKAQPLVVVQPKPKMIHMAWPDDPNTVAWVVVSSDNPDGPFGPYAITTRTFIDIPVTKSKQFFNYCRAQDYGS